MTAALPADLDLALYLADAADRVTLAAFRRPDLAVETKPDLTPVTDADRAAEHTIREALDVRNPDDAVVGEEFGTTGAGDRRWIVDPIDGTKNFVRGIPVWATLIALEDAGQLTVGVVSAPALGRRWWAGKGLGAFACDIPSRIAGAPGPVGGVAVAGGGERSPSQGPATKRRGTPISVSRVATLADAQLSGASLDGWDERGLTTRVVDLALRCWRDRSFGDFWSHMLVAEGACDIGLDPVASLWDLAALQVIVEEAGGRFTDLDGHPRADGGSGISSNGLLHRHTLDVLAGRA
ncbi:MAG: histidinol phosphatase [Acidimicrobiaceae bacterium]|nr:histidinol phosphatase [Acidimicrobiaceae bacterium]